MDRDQLCAQHPLKLVARLHAFHGSDRCVELASALLGIAVLHPQRSVNLSDEDPSEILVVGTADQPQRGRLDYFFLRRLLCPHPPLRVMFARRVVLARLLRQSIVATSMRCTHLLKRLGALARSRRSTKLRGGTAKQCPSFWLAFTNNVILWACQFDY